MSFEFIRKLPTPTEIKEEFPVPEKLAALKAQRDKEIADVITGKSDKFLAIIGPCSADNEDAVLDYTLRLKKVQEKIADKVLIVPRVYTNKPRTTGTGYKGMLHQPDPEKKPDLLARLIAIRKMHIRVMEETELMPADEMLYPENYWFLADVLSYVAIGARSVEDQQHRLTASGMDVPAGMKNPTSGDFSVMLNSVIAAQAQQSFIYRNWVRRQILMVDDGNDTLALSLMKEMLSYGSRNSEVVILEGIMYADWYRTLFVQAKELYRDNIYAYYFDIPFEETVRRHQMRDKCNEFGAEAMRKWWREKDYSDVLDERIIGQEYDKDSIVNKIYCDVMGV